MMPSTIIVYSWKEEWGMFLGKNGVIRVVLVSLLLTLNIFHTLFYCFYCWLWVGKCRLSLLDIFSNRLINLYRMETSYYLPDQKIAKYKIIKKNFCFLFFLKVSLSYCLKEFPRERNIPKEILYRSIFLLQMENFWGTIFNKVTFLDGNLPEENFPRTTYLWIIFSKVCEENFLRQRFRWV